MTLFFLVACTTGSATVPDASAPGAVEREVGSIRLVVHDPSDQTRPLDTCTTELCTPLLDMIEAASETIDFAFYGVRNQQQIVAALEAAKGRGVRVRGVVDRDLDGKNYYSGTEDMVQRIGAVRSDFEAERTLAKQAKKKGSFEGPDQCQRPEGFEGYLQCLAYDLGEDCLYAVHAAREKFGEKGGIMHNKFVVVDGRFVWTGSTNLSDSGVGGYNANLVLVLDSPTLADWYTDEFEQMYVHDRYHALKRSAGPMKVIVGDAEIELMFSPQDHAITERVRPLLREAKSKIDIAVFYLTHKGVTADLIEAHHRGVKIRVIVDATSATNGYTKHELLRQVGIPTKVENWGGKMHMKSAAIDGEWLVGGSMNWTSAGEYDNDENTLIIHSSALAGQYHRAFDKLWTRIDERWLEGRPDPESVDSGSSCADGFDNDYDSAADGDDPGCGPSPPPLPTLPPHWIAPRGEAITCRIPKPR